MALRLTVCQEWADGITDFLHVGTDSQKLKVDPKNCGGHGQKGCGQSGNGTLKLTVSQKWTDGKKWFLLAGTNPGKHKVDSIIFGWAWSKMAMAC